MEDNTDKNEELEEIEEKLIREDQEAKKQEMPVSGKSVFDIKRIKDKDSKK